MPTTHDQSNIVVPFHEDTTSCGGYTGFKYLVKADSTDRMIAHIFDLLSGEE